MRGRYFDDVVVVPEEGDETVVVIVPQNMDDAIVVLSPDDVESIYIGDQGPLVPTDLLGRM